jgi:hypothetical protein
MLPISGGGYSLLLLEVSLLELSESLLELSESLLQLSESLLELSESLLELSESLLQPSDLERPIVILKFSRFILLLSITFFFASVIAESKKIKKISLKISH